MIRKEQIKFLLWYICCFRTYLRVSTRLTSSYAVRRNELSMDLTLAMFCLYSRLRAFSSVDIKPVLFSLVSAHQRCLFMGLLVLIVNNNCCRAGSIQVRWLSCFDQDHCDGEGWQATIQQTRTAASRGDRTCLSHDELFCS